MRKLGRKILSIILVMAMIMSSGALAIMTNAAETEISIATAEDFNNIRNNLDGKYKLTGNIDLSMFNSWTPIGSDDAPFTGTIDGNGYSILNLKIKSSEITGLGLFGSINGATVKKVIIKNANYEVTVGDYDTTIFSNVGGFTGTAYNSVIDCCSFTGTITHTVGDYVYCRTGGITGSACNTTISNSYVNATISGSANACNTMVAGFSPWLDNATIDKCYVAGSITANNTSGYTYAGGFSASANSASIWGWIYSYGGTVKNSVNLLSEFNVTGSTQYSDSIGNFIQSYSNKTISPTSADATTVSTYSNLGWDFSNIWKIDGGLPYFAFGHHQWFFDKENTTLACSHCNEIYYLSPNKNFKFGRDNFSFKHIDVASNDISLIGHFYMKETLKLDIIALAANKFIAGKAYLDNKKKGNNLGTWGGSCYGIACMDASFLSGRVKTSDYGGSSVYDLSLDTKLKDSINIMMYSQASISNLELISTPKNKTAVSAAKDISSNGYLPVITYKEGEEGSHSVNVIGILPDDFDSDYYVLPIYDCNYVDEPQFIIISKDYKSAYLGKFCLDNSDAPIYLSTKITIKKVNTDISNNINVWAPRLSTSPLYGLAKTRSRARTMNLAETSEDIDSNISDDYIRFLLASDGELTVTGDDGSSFVYNDGEITETNIDNIYCEHLDDLGVTKIAIPNTNTSFKIKCDYQYYANVTCHGKIAIAYCENGGEFINSCENGIEIKSANPGSKYELSCYDYDLFDNSDIVGCSFANTDNGMKIAYKDNAINAEIESVETASFYVQHNNENLDTEKIDLLSKNNLENIDISYQDDELVIDYNLSECQHSDSNHDGVCDTCNKDLTAECDHICHSTNEFLQFIWKIFRFIYRTFGLEDHHYCDCEKAHW